MPRQYTSPEYKRNRAALLAGNPLCHWCGTAPASEADHLIEVDRGGTDELSSLVASCKPCNSRRGQLYKAQRDRQRQAQRNQAVNAGHERKKENTDNTSFFTEPATTPTFLSSLSFSDQPELATTGADRLELVPNAQEQPRLVTADVGVNSYGPRIHDWAQEYMNVDLMPWQMVALNGQLQHDEAGALIFRESLVSTARQNGKTIALVALIGWWLTDFAKGRGAAQSVLSTANKLDRAEAIFTQLAPILQEKFGAKLMQPLGRKSATLPDGSKWEVRAASTSLHGGSHDLIIVDELWNIPQPVIDDALRPSQIARRSPLMSSWSTAGDEGATAMIQMREQCLAEIDAGIVGKTYFAEWSLPPGSNPSDEALWGYANPALGITIDLDALRAVSKKESFLRAHLNTWVSARGAWLGEPGVWEECKADVTVPAGGVLAVDSSVDESRYVGVRAVQMGDKVHALIEFVCDSEAGMWEQINRVMTDIKVTLAITPTLEIHLPTNLARRYSTVGYGELLRYSTLVRSMVIEDRVTHSGQQTLAEHINRAVMVKTAQGAVLSSQRSPGPIEAARCFVWAVAMVSKPIQRSKPMLVISKG